MGFDYNPAGLTVDEILDHLIHDHTIVMTLMDRLRYSTLTSKGPWLADHFEARTLADLFLPYTGTAVGGGTINMEDDDNPSCAHMASGAVLNDGYQLRGDRCFSLLGLGGQTLCFETQARISTEANISYQMGFFNTDTNQDRVCIILDTAAAVPQPDGALYTQVAGANNFVAATLASTLDLTLYHVYRLEYEPATEARLYVDDILEATQAVGGNVPPDMSYYPGWFLNARAAANVELDVDYWRVWSE